MLLETKKMFQANRINISNVADTGMIVFTDEPLPCWKPKEEWKFKC